MFEALNRCYNEWCKLLKLSVKHLMHARFCARPSIVDRPGQVRNQKLLISRSTKIARLGGENVRDLFVGILLSPLLVPMPIYDSCISLVHTMYDPLII